jgi:hypothetical protein
LGFFGQILGLGGITEWLGGITTMKELVYLIQNPADKVHFSHSMSFMGPVVKYS